MPGQVVTGASGKAEGRMNMMMDGEVAPGSGNSDWAHRISSGNMRPHHGKRRIRDRLSNSGLCSSGTVLTESFCLVDNQREPWAFQSAWSR